MMDVALFFSADRVTAREAAIHDHLRVALAASATVVSQATPPPSHPGLRSIKSGHRVVALGRDAHAACADLDKTTLIAAALHNAPSQSERDMAVLVWSSLQTRKLITLGHAAWSTSQLWPVAMRQSELVPPIRLTSSARKEGEPLDVLIIDHEDDGRTANDLAAGFRARSIDPTLAASDAAWHSTAAVHIHVGRHGRDSEQIRLVDSWCSGKLVLQLLPHWRTAAHDDDHLGVDAEVNGFSCRMPGAIFDCYDDLCGDAVLRSKMREAGLRTAAPLHRDWRRIAADLLG